MSRNPGVGSHWDVLGQHWDVLGCHAEGRGPSKPPAAGEGPWGDPGSLKASAAAGSCPHGHLWVVKGHLLCPVFGGIQLNPKSSAGKWKEKALCSHG